MIRVLACLFGALMLAAPARAETQTGPSQVAWDHVARVVVIGDLHGDFGKFHDQLSQAGLIDARDNWAGKQTHLVQLGDVPDRAPDTRRILDLLIKLEPQARKAGGYVHALIGNHEAMNMQGDLRYTTPGEFAAFADRDSARRRDAYYAATLAALKAKPPAEGVPAFDDAFRAKFDADHPLGWVEHMAAWAPDGVYGKWVTTHAAVIRIDDALYLHGGIGPAYLPFDADTMDAAVIAALRRQPAAPDGPPDILWNEQGPLWYRGMAQNEEAAEAAHVAAALKRYGVARIVLGHTKRYSMVNARFDGAVVLTDIAVKGGCADPHAFLIKEGPTLTAAYRGRTLPLGVAGEAKTRYLAAIADLDKAAGVDASCAVN